MAPTDDENRALPPPDLDDGDDDDDAGRSSAADDPTDVWDEERLRAAGVSFPGSDSAPATKSGVSVEESVVVGRAPEAPRAPAPRAPPSRGLSWPLTIAVALIAALAAYFAIRFMR